MLFLLYLSSVTHVVIVDIENVKVGRVVVDSVDDLASSDLVAAVWDGTRGLEIVVEVSLGQVVNQALLEIVEVVVKSWFVEFSATVVLSRNECRRRERRSECVQETHVEILVSDSRRCKQTKTKKQ
jgi:hypothetical protein